jgi:hypothetical protein
VQSRAEIGQGFGLSSAVGTEVSNRRCRQAKLNNENDQPNTTPISINPNAAAESEADQTNEAQKVTPQDLEKIKQMMALQLSGLTEMEAGHSEQTLFANYRELTTITGELVTPTLAGEFWGISPGV